MTQVSLKRDVGLLLFAAYGIGNLVGESYWRGLFDPDYLVDEGVIDAEDRELFWYAETAREIWDGIQLWHENSGTPLVPTGDQP